MPFKHITHVCASTILAVFLCGAGHAQTPDNVIFEGEGAADLVALIKQSMREGKSNAYIGSLIKEDADNGQVTVTGNMLNASGAADVKAIIAMLADNTMETEQAEPVAMTESSDGEKRYHEVKRGESLADIARIYYNDPEEYLKIYTANRDQIRNANVINPGQRLVIPE